MEPPNSQSSPPAKYVALNDSLYDYIVHHRSRVVDPLLDALRRETESLGDAARMLISPEQGDFLTLLTKLLGVRTAVEIGTFTGYSSICIARGLVEEGRLFCFDTSAEWTAIAQRYWAKGRTRESHPAHPGRCQTGVTDLGTTRAAGSRVYRRRQTRLRHLLRDPAAKDETKRPVYFRQHGLGRSSH